MSKLIDLTGMRFGRLAVLYQAPSNKYGQTLWHCRCDCGVEKDVNAQSIRVGHSRSCRCLHYEGGPGHPCYGKYKDDGREPLTPEYLRQKYEIEKMSSTAIARETNRSKGSVRNRLIRCGISLRSRSEASRLYSRTPREKRKPSPWIGRRHRPESIEKMKRFHRSDAQKRGPDSPQWKGGISTITSRIRGSIENSDWRVAVFIRDQHTCQKCRKIGGKLQAHHITNFSTIYNQDDSIVFDLNNGITFCNECHNKFHRKFGIKNNNIEQVNTYLRTLAP